MPLSFLSVRPGRSRLLLDIDRRWFLRFMNNVRLGLASNHRLIHDNFFRRRRRWQVVHRIEQHAFQNGAQTTRAGLAFHGPLGDSAQCVIAEFELNAFHIKQFSVLFRQCVFRLEQNADECVLIQFLKRRYNRQAADKFRNQSEANEILRLYVVQQLANARRFSRNDHE